MLKKMQRNSNKGFTLVELIVVIVILAILVGVTIAGVMGYVAKARKNTDINNAAAIESSLAVLTTDKTICKAGSEFASQATASSASKEFNLIWSKPIKASSTALDYSKGGTVDTDYKALTAVKPVDTGTDCSSVVYEKLATAFPDGLPGSKSGNFFKLTIGFDVKGSPYVICKVYDSIAATNQVVGAEE